MVKEAPGQQQLEMNAWGQKIPTPTAPPPSFNPQTAHFLPSKNTTKLFSPLNLPPLKTDKTESLFSKSQANTGEHGHHMSAQIKPDHHSPLQPLSQAELAQLQLAPHELWHLMINEVPHGPYALAKLKNFLQNHPDFDRQTLASNCQERRWKPLHAYPLFTHPAGEQPEQTSSPTINEECNEIMLMRDGRPQGPYTREQIHQRLSQKKILWTNLISTDRAQSWHKLYRHPHFNRRQQSESKSLPLMPTQSVFAHRNRRKSSTAHSNPKNHPLWEQPSKGLLNLIHLVSDKAHNTESAPSPQTPKKSLFPALLIATAGFCLLALALVKFPSLGKKPSPLAPQAAGKWQKAPSPPRQLSQQIIPSSSPPQTKTTLTRSTPEPPELTPEPPHGSEQPDLSPDRELATEFREQKILEHEEVEDVAAGNYTQNLGEVPEEDQILELEEQMDTYHPLEEEEFEQE